MLADLAAFGVDPRLVKLEWNWGIRYKHHEVDSDEEVKKRTYNYIMDKYVRFQFTPPVYFPAAVTASPATVAYAGGEPPAAARLPAAARPPAASESPAAVAASTATVVCAGGQPPAASIPPAVTETPAADAVG